MGHRARPIGRPETQSRDVALLRAALFIDQMDLHCAQPRVGLETVNDRSQQPRVEEFSVVVEEHDEARVSCGCADVAAAGDPHVLGQHDQLIRPVGVLVITVSPTAAAVPNGLPVRRATNS